MKTDSAASDRGSQLEAEFPALPGEKWGGALVGGAPGFWAVRLTRLQARERMKPSVFTLGIRGLPS